MDARGFGGIVPHRLLTWRGDAKRVIAVTRWKSEQEPLPTVNRRKALFAERSHPISLGGVKMEVKNLKLLWVRLQTSVNKVEE
jgi:hypothetical protein